MFDSVGRNLDEEATTRTVVSAVLTVGLLMMGLMALFCYGTYWVAKEVLDLNLDDEDMIEIVMEDQELEAPPPPPPPPPPPAAAQEEEQEEPEPDEMVEEVKELDKLHSQTPESVTFLKRYRKGKVRRHL